MRATRILFSAVLVGLALLTTTHAQGTSPKRTKIDPFQVSLEPLDHELSDQEGFLVRSEVEQVLSNYLKNVHIWPSTLTVVFVAVARVLSNFPIVGSDGTVIGSRLTFDGLIYFSDASTNIPTSTELQSVIADALNPEILVAALQRQFPSVSSVAIEQSLTPWPTESPTLSPLGVSTSFPTAAPSVLKAPTSMPTVPSTDYPTLTPTLTPTSLEQPSTREPTSMSLTAVPVEMTSSPTMEPSEEELPPTAEPTRETPSPTTPSPTMDTPMPTLTTASPTLTPTVFATVLPTKLPTELPTISPSASPTVATRGPQDVSEVIDEPKLVANKDTNPATVAGAVTASLLLVLILAVLFTRRSRAREEENPETTDDILNDLKETEARTEPVPTQTFSPSSGGGGGGNPEEEYDEECSPKGGGFLKYFGGGGVMKQRGQDDPPHLAMTDGSDAGESDASELRSDGEQTSSLAELYRGWWPRPSTAAASAASVSSSGASAMVNSVESFERRKVDNHMIRKDILESPDLSAATLSQYKTSQALRASMVNEEEYDCALAPTDISAASLALKPRRDESGGGGGEDVEQVLKPNFSEDSSSESRNKSGNDRDVEGDMLSSGFAALFHSWWGASKPSRHGSLLTDDDTFGGQGDWDPDDETRTSDEHSLPSKVDGEEQSSLLDSTKNATYQMQRLRTPPEGPGTRPRPIAAPVGPRELPATPLKSNMKSPPRTPITSRAPGSPHPILHHEVGEPTEDVYDL